MRVEECFLYSDLPLFLLLSYLSVNIELGAKIYTFWNIFIKFSSNNHFYFLGKGGSYAPIHEMLDILKKIKDPILSDSTNIMGGGTLIEQELSVESNFKFVISYDTLNISHYLLNHTTKDQPSHTFWKV